MYEFEKKKRGDTMNLNPHMEYLEGYFQALRFKALRA